jgi:hypothetical protein
MEREQVERLAMDEAAGELNEDAAALLHAYLTEHAEASQWAQEIARTCRQVRAAVEKKTASTPIEIRRMPPAGRAAVRLHWLAPARWAAVIALGLLLGLQLGRHGQSPPPAAGPLVPAPAVSSNEREQGTSATGRPSGFWQAKAVMLREAKPHAGESRDVRENLWEKYRQYLKERQHG